MNKTKHKREGRLPNCLGVRKKIIYVALHYLDTKVEEIIFEVILIYLGINDEIFFHQPEPTEQTMVFLITNFSITSIH